MEWPEGEKKKKKAKAGWELSYCVANSLMLNTKTAPCQGAAKAELLQRQNKLGNEGNPCAAPHHLNGAGPVVVIGSMDHSRQGEINWKVQDPPRKPNQDRAEGKATLQVRSGVHPQKPAHKPGQQTNGTGTSTAWLREQQGAQSWPKMGLLDRGRGCGWCSHLSLVRAIKAHQDPDTTQPMLWEEMRV